LRTVKLKIFEDGWFPFLCFTLSASYCLPLSFDLLFLRVFRFVTQEQTLFKYRLEALSPEELKTFMFQAGVTFNMVSDEEKSTRSQLLVGLADIKNVYDLDRTTIYK
jgi:hypothetical protein